MYRVSDVSWIIQIEDQIVFTEFLFADYTNRTIQKIENYSYCIYSDLLKPSIGLLQDFTGFYNWILPVLSWKLLYSLS